MRRNLGHEILKRLDQPQLADLLDALMTRMSSSQMEGVLQELEEETQDILVPLYQGQGLETLEKHSRNRHVQKWIALWEEWGEAVDEMEPPGEVSYDDEGMFWEADENETPAEELEGVAERMLPLMPKIVELGVEEEHLFETALDDIEKSFKDLPEYLSKGHLSYVMGPQLTRCLLTWTRLNAKGMAAFLESIFDIDERLEIFILAEGGIQSFVSALNEADRREMFEFLASRWEDPLWWDKLVAPFSPWRSVLLSLFQAFDQQVYLKACGILFYGDWQFGLPILEDQLQRGDLEGANETFEQIFGRFLFFDQTKPWKPESSLLSTKTERYPNFSEQIVNLLAQWEDVAQRANLAMRAKALRIQRSLLMHPNDWNRAMGVIQELREPNLKDLIEQWKVLTMSKLLPFRGLDKENWVRWLLDAGSDDNRGASWFLERTREWLVAINEGKLDFLSQMNPFFLLTCDLAAISDLNARYPHTVELAYHFRISGESRQEWLRKLGGTELIPLVMACWRDHVRLLMPDPAKAGGANYDRHALWLKAAEELNIEVFQTTLERWKRDHKRRKNLWASLRRRKIEF